jgi:hypothetical protein
MNIGEMMMAVIIESWDEANKLHRLDFLDTLSRLIGYASDTDRIFKVGSSPERIKDNCEKLLKTALVRKRGYVFKDLENIIYLGYDGTLRYEDKHGDKELPDPDAYVKWFERYGVNKTEQLPDDRRVTKRGAYLMIAARKLEEQNRLSPFEVTKFLAQIPSFI